MFLEFLKLPRPMRWFVKMRMVSLACFIFNFTNLESFLSNSQSGYTQKCPELGYKPILTVYSHWTEPGPRQEQGPEPEQCGTTRTQPLSWFRCNVKASTQFYTTPFPAPCPGLGLIQCEHTIISLINSLYHCARRKLFIQRNKRGDVAQSEWRVKLLPRFRPISQTLRINPSISWQQTQKRLLNRPFNQPQPMSRSDRNFLNKLLQMRCG